MGLLLLEWGLGGLCVGEDADDGSILLDALELASDGLAAALGVLFGVLGEGLPLALVPVLVESSLDLQKGGAISIGSKSVGGQRTRSA